MGRYVAWLEVKPHVQDYEAQPDQSQMNAAIGVAEDHFDNGLRERYTVPFTAAQPEAFALAKKIVAMWAAANYLVNARQTEADEERATWYADRLAGKADMLYDVFLEGAPPADAPASSDPFSQLPQDGYSDLSTTEQSDLEPIFRRGHLVSGDSRHW